MENLKNKTVVITGASQGIGKATALKLASIGFNIVMLGGRNKDNALKVKEEIEKFGVKCFTVLGDLTDKNFLNSAVKEITEKVDTVDVLINNAGMGFSGKFENVSEQEFDNVMNLDVKVPFFLTQKLLPYIKKSSSATIINIASSVGHIGYELQSAYSMAKHAVLGFSKSLARELYKENVRVHVISPGGVFTDMIKKTRPDLTGDNMIQPEDVANTIAFLLSNRTNAVIDEIIMHRVGKEPFTI